ncbi:MAG: flagellar hook-basal body complex protein, partial [Deltaproteobacteria bacterium]|nr:flagellar hook-basal body complex protein [Deltaproteobacteria bacterium]
MGAFRSIYTGYNGMMGQDTGINVISNNIANQNTIGFKSNQASFQEILLQAGQTVPGLDNVGAGGAISSINSNFTEGTITSSTVSTNMALNGSGFFNVGGFLTRAGDFRMDSNGYLVNAANLNVKGWNYVDSVKGPGGDITNIRIWPLTSPPQATTKTDLGINLDSRTSSEASPATVASNSPVTSDFMFISGKNDVVSWSGDGGKTVTNISLITDGGLTAGKTYSGADVAKAINQALTKTSPSKTNTYTAAYDSTSGHFSVTNGGSNSTAQFYWGSSQSTAATTLGFAATPTVNLAPSQKTESSSNVAFNVVTDAAGTTGNNTFQITVDHNPVTGKPVDVTLNQGTYSAAQMATEMQNQINKALTTAGETSQVNVAYDDTNQVFKIMSQKTGSTSFVQVGPGQTDFLAGINVTDYTEKTGSSSNSTAGQVSSSTDVTESFTVQSSNNGVVFN